MAHGPLNGNVVRHDLVVGSGPREPSDLDALRLETHVSAILSVHTTTAWTNKASTIRALCGMAAGSV